MRQIYVNLPVKDLEASKRFFTELGFAVDPEFSDERAAAIVFGDNIYAMLLTEDFFRGFISDEIANGEVTEVINCLSAESRDEADALHTKALAAGGAEHKPRMEEGPMYMRSFADPDGHIWEILHMEIG